MSSAIWERALPLRSAGSGVDERPLFGRLGAVLATVTKGTSFRTCHLTLAHFSRRNGLMGSSANPAQSSEDRAAFPGRLAGAVQITFAVLIGGASALAGGGSPEFPPRGLVLFAIYAIPGIVGLIGVAERRPALLLAAAATSTVGSVIAFSGVTLIFLVPAILFLYGAVRIASVRSTAISGFASGILAGSVLAAVLTVLTVGAGASALLITDEQCWATYETPGGVRYEAAPYTTGEMGVPTGAVAFSCSTGVISLRGVGLASLLGSGALALAVATRRRPKDAVDSRLPA
jgi:hypothetical protein